MRRSCLLLLSAPVLLSLSSCRIANGRVDFSPVEERFSEARSDEVVIDRGTGSLSAAPLPPVPASTPPAAVSAPVARTTGAAPIPPTPAVRKPNPPAAAPGTYTVRAGDTLTYTVRAGDTLYAIARRHGCSPAALSRANAWDPAKPLRIGQQLRIPGGAAVAKAPSHSAPARHAAPHAGRTYTVQQGDTLSRIAKRYGLTPAALMHANRISPADAHRLRVGAILSIPAK